MTELPPDFWTEADDDARFLMEEAEPVRMIDQIAEVGERWVAQPRNRNPRIVSMAGAVVWALSNEATFIDAAQNMIVFREAPDVNQIVHSLPKRSRNAKSEPLVRRVPDKIKPVPFPEYGMNVLIRGLLHEFRKPQSEINLREATLSVPNSIAAIRKIMSNPELAESFSLNTAWREITTTVPGRARGPRLAIEAHRGRFKSPIVMVSVGHGSGWIEKTMLENRPMPPMPVWHWHGWETALMRPSDRLTSNLNERLRKPADIAHCYAIDILPGDKDPATAEWSLSCLTPTEQLDTALMAEIDYLSGVQPSNYTSLQGDFARADGRDIVGEAMGGQKADIVMFLTVWYMLEPEERKAMLANALKLLSPGGLILVQDHVQIRRPTIPSPSMDPVEELYFMHDWGQWDYRLLGMDTSQNALHFEDIAHFIDGRCREVIFTPKYDELLF